MAAHRFTWDVAERLVWTAIEIAAGLAITETTSLDTWWAGPIGLGLALLKAFAAKHVGQSGTASSLPAHADPAGGVTPIPPPASL